MGVRGRVIGFIVCGAVAAAAVPSTAGAAAPYVMAGMYPGLAVSPTERLADRNQGTPDLTAPYALYQRTGKGQAVINLFGNADTVTRYFADIWDSRNSIPMLSYYAPDGGQTAKGLHDAQLLALIQALKTYVAGPNRVISPNDPDDRRAYLRYGWESNISGYAYSPCHRLPVEPGPGGGALGAGTDFAGGWRHAHKLFTDNGLDSAHVAWVFSVGSSDNCSAGRPEATFPGSAYVDWLGLDVYSNCGGESVATVANDMVARLRALDPGAPLSIDEAGVWNPDNATKNAWITDYWNYVSANDIRMALWFNADPGPYGANCANPQSWSVIGPTHGDDIFTAWDQAQQLTSRQWHAYSAYEAGLKSAGIVTSRLGVTPAQFLGR